MQLEFKLQCKELPLGLKFHVISDPPGTRAG